MSENQETSLSVLNDALINIRSDEFVQYVKGLQDENESVKLFGTANYPLLVWDEDKDEISYNVINDNKKYAGIVSVGATEYPTAETGTAKSYKQGIVKIATEQSYTAEDGKRMKDIKNYLATSGAFNYLELLKALEFEKKPSALYQRIYNIQDLICFVGSEEAEKYRKSGSFSATVSVTATNGAYGVLNHPAVRGSSDERVLAPEAVNAKQTWAEKYNETNGAESIVQDVVNMKNTLDNDLMGLGIEDSEKQLILPKKLVLFLKQKPYDYSNNLGRKLFYEVIERIGFAENQIVASEKLDLMAFSKGYGILMVKDPNYFGCINSEAHSLNDEYQKDVTIISANAKTAGFKCAFPNAIRLIKGLA